MGATFILAINISLAAAIMVSFLAIGLYDRSLRCAFWWFACCGAAFLSGSLEYLLPGMERTYGVRFFIFTFFALAMTLLAGGLAQRYRGRAPIGQLAVAFALSVGCYLAIADMPRSSLMRNLGYQLPYSALILVGAWHVYKGMSRHTIDRVLLATLVFNALQFPARPLLVILLGGPGATARDYLGTSYAMASQSLMAIMSMMLAVVLGMRLILDVMESLRRETYTDSLSALLNRSGFLRDAGALLARSSDDGKRRAIVLCDLDEFKKVNDTYGHQAGDAAIAAFGGLVQALCQKEDITGRLGGEEFCILLEGADVKAARLYAETLRHAFHQMTLPGLPETTRLSASLGVTEIAAGESFAQSFSRADAALYEAKNAGRNCVRLRLRAEPEVSPAADHQQTRIA